MKVRCQPSRGFTLVELVLAVGITAVLAALLLSIVTNTLGIWQRGAASLQIENAGGLVMDRLHTDLAGWGRTAGQDGWRWTDGGPEGQSELRFLSTVASTAPVGAGDPAGPRLVVYQWDAPNLRLYRWESTVAESLEDGYSLDATAAASGPEWLLADGVRGFAVRWRDDAGTELTAGAAGGPPRQAEVELTLIDESGRTRLAAVAAGASGEAVSQIEAETTRTLSRWVELTGGGRW